MGEWLNWLSRRSTLNLNPVIKTSPLPTSTAYSEASLMTHRQLSGCFWLCWRTLLLCRCWTCGRRSWAIYSFAVLFHITLIQKFKQNTAFNIIDPIQFPWLSSLKNSHIKQRTNTIMKEGQESWGVGDRESEPLTSHTFYSSFPLLSIVAPSCLPHFYCEIWQTAAKFFSILPVPATLGFPLPTLSSPAPFLPGSYPPGTQPKETSWPVHQIYPRPWEHIMYLSCNIFWVLYHGCVHFHGFKANYTASFY